MSYCSRCGKWSGAIAVPAGTEPTWCICSKDNSSLVATLGKQVDILEKELSAMKEEYLNASADAMKFAGELERIREAAGVSDDKGLVDWIYRIRGRCDTYDWERQTLDHNLTLTKLDLETLASKVAALVEAVKATKEKALYDAWQRVSSGQVIPDPDSIYNNAKMFDYPRYTWDELERLIKGIK